MDNSLISYSCILVYLKKPGFEKTQGKTGLFEKTRVLLGFFKILGFLPTLGVTHKIIGDKLGALQR